MRRRLRLLSTTAAAATLVTGTGTAFLVRGAPAAADVGGPVNVVVYRVGAAGGTLTNAAAPVFLDRYASDGTLQGSVAVRTATSGAQHALTASGLSRSEGQLSVSPDGRVVAFTGYDAPVGATGPDVVYQDVNGTDVHVTESLTASSPTTVGRVVGLLDGNQVVDTSTSVTGSAVPHVLRSATTVDGQTLWLGGTDGGVLTTTRGASSATPVLSTAGLDVTALAVRGGQLLASGGYDGEPAKRVVTVGAGTPTSGAAVTGLNGLPAGLLPDGFAALDLTSSGAGSTGLDTLYVANAAEKGGALDKFVFDGSAWGKRGSIPLDGVLSLTAKATGTAVQLVATTATGLWSVTETDATAAGFTGTPTRVASAPAGTEFRGVALAPTGAAAGPAVTVSSPTGAQHVSYLTRSLLVKGTATASQGVAGVTVKTDSGGAFPASLSGTSWSRTITVSSLAVGRHTLTIAAKESTTGAVTTVTRTFVRDGVPAGALGPGPYSFLNAKISRSSGWTALSYSASPDKRALRTTGTSYVKLTSYGRGLDLHFQRRADAGKVRITIDGHAYVVDLKSSSTGDLLKAFRGLSAAKHAITIQALHQRSSGSKGYVVLLGSLRVYA